MGRILNLFALSPQRELVTVEQVVCPLWQDLRHLSSAIAEFHQRYDLRAVNHAVTMTGELCDSFENRSVGVRSIAEILSSSFISKQLRLYGLDGRWVCPSELDSNISQVASANWAASANFLAKSTSPAIVVDIGSTTTDVICIKEKRLCNHGFDDFTRLKAQELIYTGLVRTPIAAIVDNLPYAGVPVPVMAETFAVAADAYRILGQMPSNADLYPTADGAAKTQEASARRLLRMIGRDYLGDYGHAREMALHVQKAQLTQIAAAIRKHLQTYYARASNVSLIGMGCGAHLVEIIAKQTKLNYRAFDSFLGALDPDANETAIRTSVNVCGPAVAVAYEYAEAASSGTSP